jgi:hypothetical protein
MYYHIITTLGEVVVFSRKGKKARISSTSWGFFKGLCLEKSCTDVELDQERLVKILPFPDTVTQYQNDDMTAGDSRLPQM